ncbi:MAG: NADP oxidoreductase [Candidatus Hydrogenedens sp.]
METKYRIGIIGSGPSGFFSAEHILRLHPDCEIDMYERYPDPFGLVRKGVAPDNPNIRNVSKAFDIIAENKRFAYFGNVDVGIDITLAELQNYYDAIIIACGMETSQRLEIPGEDLAGSYTASSIVGWYNCHPVYHSLDIKLEGKRAVIIGMGNVALDVARILCRPVSELSKTDISNHAIKVLGESKLKEVYIVGRRGPTQAKFKENELLSLEEVGDTDIIIEPSELEINESSREEMTNHPSIQRMFEYFKKFSMNKVQKNRQIYFTFLRSPIRIVGDGKVEQIMFEKNVLEGLPYKQRAVGTGIIEKMDCDYVISSIGYRGNRFPGLPYDETKGVIPNRNGRVVKNDEIVPGIYVTGWIKRGPVGLIGHNKPDSLETVKNLLDDLSQLKENKQGSREDVIKLLKSKNIQFINYDDWKRIDSSEIERGKIIRKIRERFCMPKDMLRIVSEDK